MNTKFQNNLTDNKGFILPLFPFVLITMLVVLGLVVDSTNIYAARVKAGAAAELGVLSAAGARIIEKEPAMRINLGGSLSFETNYLNDRYKKSSTQNLSKNGIVTPANPGGMLSTKLTDTRLTVSPPSGPSGARLITGTVDLDVPVFFAGIRGLISGNPRTVQRVTGSATTQLRGSAFVFLIDLSSSQNCPSVGACLCNTPQRTGTCRQEAQALQSAGRGTGRVRVEDIIQATSTIISGNNANNVPVGLDPNRDRIAIIIYNNSAQVLLHFDHKLNAANPTLNNTGQIVQPGFDPVIATNALRRIQASDAPPDPNSIRPNGNTNISDALMTAENEIRRVGLFNPAAQMQNNINVILLTEGAATAMRLKPASPALAANTPVGDDPDKHRVTEGDFIQYGLTLQTASGTPTNPPQFVQIPGPFVHTLIYKRTVTHRQANRPAKSPMAPRSIDPINGYQDNAHLPNCHLGPANPTQVDQRLFSLNVTDRAAALNRCLNNSWQFKPVVHPRNSFNSGMFSVGGSLSNTGGVGDFRQLYYLATVIAAEDLSSAGVKLFTLAWEELDAPDPTALFGVNSVSQVKMDVLANLSNDRFTANWNPKNPDVNDPWGQSGIPIGLFGSTQKGFKGRFQRGFPQGASYRAISGPDFQRLFSQIILQAKLSTIKLN